MNKQLKEFMEEHGHVLRTEHGNAMARAFKAGFKAGQKSAKPSVAVDWEQVPSVFKYVAMDEGGQWCAFIKKPMLCAEIWDTSTAHRGGSYVCLGDGVCSINGDMHWSQTLQARP